MVHHVISVAVGDEVLHKKTLDVGLVKELWGYEADMFYVQWSLGKKQRWEDKNNVCILRPLLNEDNLIVAPKPMRPSYKRGRHEKRTAMTTSPAHAHKTRRHDQEESPRP